LQKKSTQSGSNQPDDVLGREIGQRIREVRGADSREKVKSLTGWHPNTVAHYENGLLPNVAFLVAFSRAYGVDLNWLVTGEGSRPNPPSDVDEDELILLSAANEGVRVGLVSVPYFEARAGAGAVQIAWDEKPVKTVALPQDIFSARGIRPDHVGLMMSSGSSMEPTISDGDLLLIDLAAQSRADGIFVIGRDGGVLVKRLQWRSDGSLIMISDNRAYEPEMLPRDDADDVRLIGRVRMVFKSV
jgi:phage repressor protein C with HTH and peptisase S24 domain